jgi:hypothetical protein
MKILFVQTHLLKFYLPKEIKLRFIRLSPIVFSTMFAGCAAVPQVEYRVVMAPDDMRGMTDAFFRQNSVIEIAYPTSKSKDSSSSPDETVLIQSKATEYRQEKLGIKALSNFSASTVVNISKRENTDLVDSIGIKVTDKLADSIKNYGSVLVKVIGLGILSNPSTPVSCSKSVYEKGLAYDISMLDLNPKEWTVSQEGGCVSLKFSALPPDAQLASAVPQGVATSNFYYSACRDVLVTVKINENATTKIVRVAEPRYVQYVQLPVDGSVKMHSECGASVTTSQVAKDSTADVLGAATDLIKNIVDAVSKK